MTDVGDALFNELAEKLQTLPDKPGVYLYKDKNGQIIYVGKAINLKNRVRSYFQTSRNHSAKVKALVARIKDLEYIVTTSEVEALILECNLIKKHRPKYNISLKDDKTYPYIKVTLQETYPKVHITRKVINDGAKYFGPYTSAGAVHETIRLIKRLFPLRTCKNMDALRPCLQFHIKRCLAPCTGNVDITLYKDMIKAVCLFIEGRSDDVVKDLKRRMELAAENFDYELAAKLRDQIFAVEKVQEKQNIITGSGDQDALGLARSAFGTCMQVFFIRSGKLVGRDYFLLEGSENEEDSEVVLAFLKEYYSRATFIPREILLPLEIVDQSLIADWLSSLKQGRVSLEVPKRGTKHDIVKMAEGNARVFLEEKELKLKESQAETTGALKELQQYLDLTKLPERIECFDISHTQGSETVASMVVFEGGKPKKEDYRRYKLLTVEGKPDDFKSMQEVVGRRYRDGYEGIVPDLIIIDGGKGQLNVALNIIRSTGLTFVPVVGLAKEFEHIFKEGEKDPVILPRHSKSLYLVQRIRDEAHRFAITYHRKLRNKRNMISVLDHIPGIGAKRRSALWDYFGSLAKIKAAEFDELIKVPGMTKPVADAVYNFFRSKAGE